MFSKVKTAVCLGIEGKLVNVETDLSNGLPSINIVGLASTTVMESKERIKMAIINSGFEYPRGRITVNLTPANLRKNGSYLDLPISIGVLISNMNVNSNNASKFGIIGELSLDGDILGVDCVLPLVKSMYNSGIKKIIVPLSNFNEANLVSGPEIVPTKNLIECVNVINDGLGKNDVFVEHKNTKEMKFEKNELDFKDIKGQENAKRAITIAVTGRHGLLMIGSPGCGKSMIAKRIPTIMPDMSEDEFLETAIINSVLGKNNDNKGICIDRPFRSPHNTIGKAGLLGGGNIPIPGEISLAHNGVLFLDEVCEFDRDKIESLRVPIEERYITHFRSGIPYSFPCNFQLIMAANPCKCGFYGDSERVCKCSISQLEQYRRKLSGPMMDRIDLKISMEKVGFEEMSKMDSSGLSSKEMKSIVLKGLNFAKKCGRTFPNSMIKDSQLDEYCFLGSTEKKLLENAYRNLKLSPRSYNRILKVSRTIADIDESEQIKEKHIAEALSFRMFNDINDE